MTSKHQFTFGIDGALRKSALAVAARLGLSVSEMLAEELRALVSGDRGYESARRRAAAMLEDGQLIAGVRVVNPLRT
jgi:hypothetical protein